MNLKRFAIPILLVLIAFSLTFMAGYFTHSQWVSPKIEHPILLEVEDILGRHALEDIPEDPALEYGMIRGMLQAFGDPHTRFAEPVQTELNNDNLEGSYGGIGATLSRDPEGFILLYPFPGGPAFEAGIIAGDRLILVDEMSITPETATEEAVAALRGPEGDPVSLTITRPPEHLEHNFEITRQNIPLPSVTWHTAPAEAKLGIVKVNLIAASTAEEIENAVADLKSQGAEYFALDLRGNGGGLVDAGVNIASLFLEDGDVLQERYRDKPVNTYEVEKPGSLMDIPLVVLVNSNTASAAEIVTGALQAHQRAEIFGTHTFGKDSIQLAFELQDGSSLHVTAAKWWIPGLEINIGETGLIPDIEVAPGEENQDAAVNAAIQYFNNGE